jgi:putative flippase GtrA
MSGDPVKPWLNRLLEFAVGVLAAAFMLSWAWALLRPLVPVIVISAAVLVTVAGVAGYIVQRWRYW